MRLRLTIRAGESLVGYLERYAAARRIPPWFMLRDLGLLDDGRLAPGFGLALAPERQARLTAGSGLTSEEVERALLSRFVPLLPSSEVTDLSAQTARQALRARWLLVDDSGFCPGCFAETGTWDLRWRLPWSFACLRHGTVLVGTCPSCRSSIGRARATGSHFASRRMPIRSRVCGSGGSCVQPLAGITALPLPADGEILRAQMFLEDALRDGTVSLTRHRVEPATLLSELRAMVALLTGVLAAEDTVGLPAASQPVIDRFLFERDRRTTHMRPDAALQHRLAWAYARPPLQPELSAATVPLALRVAVADREEAAALLAPFAARVSAQSRVTAERLPKLLKFEPRLAET